MYRHGACSRQPGRSPHRAGAWLWRSAPKTPRRMPAGRKPGFPGRKGKPRSHNPLPTCAHPARRRADEEPPPVGEVAVPQLRGRGQGGVGDAHAVVGLVPWREGDGCGAAPTARAASKVANKDSHSNPTVKQRPSGDRAEPPRPRPHAGPLGPSLVAQPAEDGHGLHQRRGLHGHLAGGVAAWPGEGRGGRRSAQGHMAVRGQPSGRLAATLGQ